MKLQIEERQLESSLVNSASFSISQSAESTAMLYDLLRKKLYTNVIGSCVREILANAIDACMEAGRDPSEIIIGLPNSLDSTFSIKDVGLGMDPEKIIQVYTVYLESTKRADDSQIGGFGVGLRYWPPF